MRRDRRPWQGRAVATSPALHRSAESLLAQHGHHQFAAGNLNRLAHFGFQFEIEHNIALLVRHLVELEGIEIIPLALAAGRNALQRNNGIADLDPRGFAHMGSAAELFAEHDSEAVRLRITVGLPQCQRAAARTVNLGLVEQLEIDVICRRGRLGPSRWGPSKWGPRKWGPRKWGPRDL